MQHDVFVHPTRRVRSSYPYLAVLQSDLAETEECIVARVIAGLGSGRHISAPIVEIAGETLVLLVAQINTVPRRLLRMPIGSVAACRDDITRVLDWLFSGF